jgi:hypothetical protein
MTELNCQDRRAIGPAIGTVTTLSGAVLAHRIDLLPPLTHQLAVIPGTHRQAGAATGHTSAPRQHETARRQKGVFWAMSAVSW